MALLRRQEFPVRPITRGRGLSSSAVQAYQRRKAQLADVYALAAHVAVQDRNVLAQRFASAIASGLEPTRAERAAWTALDREDEHWDLFGSSYISNASLPQD